MNKKGYIRTLEAIIAIIIIFIFILSILPKQESEERTPKDIDLTAEQILNEIQNNKDYRDKVFKVIITSENQVKTIEEASDESYNYIKKLIDDTKPITLDYRLIICKIDDSGLCYPLNPNNLNLPPLNIYTKSILIKGEIEERVVKLFLWRTA